MTDASANTERRLAASSVGERRQDVVNDDDLRSLIDDDLRSSLDNDLRSFVTLSRHHPSDVGDRQLYVRLDQKRMKLNYGDAFTVELQPGAHHLHVHNTLFWKNVPFTLEPGEHLEFVLINEKRWWTAGIVGAFGAAPLFLTVEKRSRV